MSVTDFFPPFQSATWTFEEKNASPGQRLPITVASQATPAGRELVLTYPSSFPHPRAFFDRMIIEENRLTLSRILFAEQKLAPQPPLVLTLDSQVNETADFFPGVPQIGLSIRPFRCATKKKTVKDGKWTIELEARGTDQSIVYRATTLEFTIGRGLTRYVGDVFGFWFVYERLD